MRSAGGGGGAVRYLLPVPAGVFLEWYFGCGGDYRPVGLPPDLHEPPPADYVGFALVWVFLVLAAVRRSV